jgi:hypothetical protein
MVAGRETSGMCQRKISRIGDAEQIIRALFVFASSTLK